MWLRDAARVKYPHFTLAHHRVSSSSVVRASVLDHGGSWVRIPSGARIFPSSQWVQLKRLSFNLVVPSFIHSVRHSLPFFSAVSSYCVCMSTTTTTTFVVLAFSFSLVITGFSSSSFKKVVAVELLDLTMLTLFYLTYQDMRWAEDKDAAQCQQCNQPFSLARRKVHVMAVHFPWQFGCRDGAVVRELASHQCGPGSIPRLGVICGLSLLVLYSAPRGFLRVLQFPLSSKTNI